MHNMLKTSPLTPQFLPLGFSSVLYWCYSILVYMAALVFRVSDGEAAYCHSGNEGGVKKGVIQLEEAKVHYMFVAYLNNAVSS